VVTANFTIIFSDEIMEPAKESAKMVEPTMSEVAMILRGDINQYHESLANEEETHELFYDNILKVLRRHNITDAQKAIALNELGRKRSEKAIPILSENFDFIYYGDLERITLLPYNPAASSLVEIGIKSITPLWNDALLQHEEDKVLSRVVAIYNILSADMFSTFTNLKLLEVKDVIISDKIKSAINKTLIRYNQK
jgi:hypothetical protein